MRTLVVYACLVFNVYFVRALVSLAASDGFIISLAPYPRRANNDRRTHFVRPRNRHPACPPLALAGFIVGVRPSPPRPPPPTVHGWLFSRPSRALHCTGPHRTWSALVNVCEPFARETFRFTVAFIVSMKAPRGRNNDPVR